MVVGGVAGAGTRAAKAVAADAIRVCLASSAAWSSGASVVAVVPPWAERAEMEDSIEVRLASVAAVKFVIAVNISNWNFSKSCKVIGRSCDFEQSWS